MKAALFSIALLFGNVCIGVQAATAVPGEDTEGAVANTTGAIVNTAEYAAIDSDEADSADAVTLQPINLRSLTYEVRYNPGKVLAMDDYVKTFIKKQGTHSIVFETHYKPVLPPLNGTREDTFEGDYNYPTISLGLRYNINHGTTMHRDEGIDWGNRLPVDYTTHLGDAVSVYGTFSRPFFRKKTWEIGYYLGAGLGYSWHKYNRTDAIDNELVGAHVSIFFSAGLEATWMVDPEWALHGGVDFAHHSNGALHRPNKGANYFGPYLGIVYIPQDYNSHNASQRHGNALPSRDTGEAPASAHATKKPFDKYWFAEVTLGYGGKALLEEWDHTQTELPPTDPNYRTEHFRIYPCYSLQADLMHRYKRCYATGLGFDLFYGTYSNDVERLDNAAGRQCKHSPWSVAAAIKHEFLYRQFSLRAALGYYIYREMGAGAAEIEKPYYERIGLHYAFRRLMNASIGFNVNAHLGKADFTEIQISLPVRL